MNKNLLACILFVFCASSCIYNNKSYAPAASKSKEMGEQVLEQCPKELIVKDRKFEDQMNQMLNPQKRFSLIEVSDTKALYLEIQKDVDQVKNKKCFYQKDEKKKESKIIEKEKRKARFVFLQNLETRVKNLCIEDEDFLKDDKSLPTILSKEEQCFIWKYPFQTGFGKFTLKKIKKSEAEVKLAYLNKIILKYREAVKNPINNMTRLVPNNLAGLLKIDEIFNTEGRGTEKRRIMGVDLHQQNAGLKEKFCKEVIIQDILNRMSWSEKNGENPLSKYHVWIKNNFENEKDVSEFALQQLSVHFNSKEWGQSLSCSTISNLASSLDDVKQAFDSNELVLFRLNSQMLSIDREAKSHMKYFKTIKGIYKSKMKNAHNAHKALSPSDEASFLEFNTQEKKMDEAVKGMLEYLVDKNLL